MVPSIIFALNEVFLLFLGKMGKLYSTIQFNVNRNAGSNPAKPFGNAIVSVGYELFRQVRISLGPDAALSPFQASPC